ncbi:hypothetical protein BOX15_Mlig012642g1 [Macrostomum lignano]|uniref:Uncharacterized protein n=1 Tax=Macrostomum lignano TaxID=282301 RepID=A0A267FAM4_9PLAT|nr:hypothetical protein BOX15_Mlig012642g1 [Macrostomum lignano]
MELEDALSSNDSEIYFASASCGPGRRVSIGDCFWSSLSKAGRCFLLRLEALYIPVQRRLRQDRAISRMASVSVFYPTSYVSRDANYGLKLKRVNAPISASGVVCVGFHRVFVPPVDFEVLRHPKPLTLTLEDFFKCIAPDACGNGTGNWAEQGYSLPDFLASSSHGKRDARSKANVLVMSVSSFNRLQRYSAAHCLYGWSREQVLGYIGDGCLAQCPAGTKVFFCRRKHPLYHVNRHASRQESLAPKRKGELRTLGRRSEQECISDLQLRVKVDKRCLRRQRGGHGGGSGEASDTDEQVSRAGRGRPKRTRHAAAASGTAANNRLSSRSSAAAAAAAATTAAKQRRKKPPSTAAARAAAVAAAAAAAPSRKRRHGRRKKGRPPKKRPKLEPATPKLEISDVSPASPPHPQSPPPTPPPPPPPPPPPLPPSPATQAPPSLPSAVALPRKRGRPRKTRLVEPANPTQRRGTTSADAAAAAAANQAADAPDATVTAATATDAASASSFESFAGTRDSIDSVIENVLSQAHDQDYRLVTSSAAVATAAASAKPPPPPPPPAQPTSPPPPARSSPFQLRLETISPAAPVTKIENEPVSPPIVSQHELYQLHSLHQLHQHQQLHHRLFPPHQHPLMHLPFPPSAAEDPAAFLQQWAAARHHPASWEAAVAAAAAAAAAASSVSMPPHFPQPPNTQFPQQAARQQHQKPAGPPPPQSMWVPQKTPCYGAPPMQMPSYPGLSHPPIPLGGGPQRFGGVSGGVSSGGGGGGAPLPSLPFLQSPAATLVPVIIANPMGAPTPSLSHSAITSCSGSGLPAFSAPQSTAAAVAAAAAAAANIPVGSGRAPPPRLPPSHPGLFLPQLNLYHGDG